MREENGQAPRRWGYSFDRELYRIAGETRESAIQEALHEQPAPDKDGGRIFDAFWVVELVAVDMLPHLIDALDLDDLFERAIESVNGEIHSEADVELDVTAEQAAMLGRQLANFMTTWASWAGARYANWYEVPPGNVEEHITGWPRGFSV